MIVSIRNLNPNHADALAHILVHANENAFRGLVPEQCLEFTEDESAANWRKSLQKGLPESHVFIVAETVEKSVVGFAWGRPSEEFTGYLGELFQIYVHPDYQGRGIGRMMIAHIAKALTRQNIHSMIVKVMQVNPNQRFYEHLGATILHLHIQDWDGVDCISCVYGWDDTQVFFEG